MMHKSWFEEWFDSPYYHLLYANRSESEAESFITGIAKYLQMPAGSKVLDVACGKGRHSKTLAKLGFTVCGIDLSHNSIEEAKQSANEQLHFAVWDMRKVYQRNTFDYVFNLFSSFGYFDTPEEDEAAIKAMHDALKPGGTLMLDYLNTEYAVRNMKAREIIQRGATQFHISKRVEKGFIKKRIEFLVDGANNEFEEQLKVINRTRFRAMLENAGFTIREILGDYELHPFQSATSPRLILIAQRND